MLFLLYINKVSRHKYLPTVRHYGNQIILVLFLVIFHSFFQYVQELIFLVLCSTQKERERKRKREGGGRKG